MVACCDLDPATLEQCKGWYGPEVRLTQDLGEVVGAADVDAVMITTPDYLHEDMAVASLEAGHSVFLEKPMAITIEGCDRILAAARDRRLYVGHNMRHTAFLREMHRLVRSGAIGEPKTIWCRHFVGHGGDFYFKDWHADRRNTTSLLLQKGAHDIDAIHWLAGGFSRRVSAFGALSVYGDLPRQSPPGGRPDDYLNLAHWPPRSQRDLFPVVDVEDLYLMMMSIDNGVLASYQQCHFTPDYWRNYTVIGTEGRLENFGNHGSDVEIRLWNHHRRDYEAEPDLVVPAPETGEGHASADRATVVEFVRYARDGGSTCTSPIAAREAVATGCAATFSLRTGGGAIDVPMVGEQMEAQVDR